MQGQEKIEINSDRLKHFEELEDFFTKEITKFRDVFEGCRKSTRYQLDQEFQDRCDNVAGLLANMEHSLEILRKTKSDILHHLSDSA